MCGTDWANGLPLDVLALVAKSRAMYECKAMREVSKFWQQAFEVGVTKIKLPCLTFRLPSGAEIAHRFPELASLDLSEASIDESWLGNARELPKLTSLILGHPPTRSPHGFPVGLTDAGLALLRGLPIASLGLGTFGSSR